LQNCVFKFDTDTACDTNTDDIVIPKNDNDSEQSSGAPLPIDSKGQKGFNGKAKGKESTEKIWSGKSGKASGLYGKGTKSYGGKATVAGWYYEGAGGKAGKGKSLYYYGGASSDDDTSRRKLEESIEYHKSRINFYKMALQKVAAFE
jgi:hypothetical protein